MTPRLSKIQYKKNFIYHIRFEDDRKGDVDFKPFLWGEAFEKLKDIAYFKKASIDNISGTIVWPNGVDIAPEILYNTIANDHTITDSRHPSPNS